MRRRTLSLVCRHYLTVDHDFIFIHGSVDRFVDTWGTGSLHVIRIYKFLETNAFFCQQAFITITVILLTAEGMST